MSVYKITNITNSLGKREYKYNSPVEFDYVDNMMKKKISIKPGDTTYLTINSLPLSIHRLRVDRLITVTEISAKELNHVISDSKPKVAPIVKTEKKEDVVSNNRLGKSNKKLNNIDKQQTLEDLLITH
jgi:hypothetical protein